MERLEKSVSQTALLKTKTDFLWRLLSDLRVYLGLKEKEFYHFCELVAKDRQFNIFIGVRVDDFTPYIKQLNKEGIGTTLMESSNLSFKIKRARKERCFPFNLSELNQTYMDYDVLIYEGKDRHLIMNETLSFFYDVWVESGRKQHFLSDEELAEYD
ncbi:hypothetical protein IJU97_04615 [bacterium]|nr:hypothetical protein [bacterium]